MGIERVGVTATSSGVTLVQLRTLSRLFTDRMAEWLHHGDCVGGDAQAHQVARALGMSVCGHPPVNPHMRAWCGCDVLLPEKPYIARNHDIVNATGELFAMPRGFTEELRSGTWATIRYARKLRRPITIIWPDGTTRVTLAT